MIPTCLISLISGVSEDKWEVTVGMSGDFPGHRVIVLVNDDGKTRSYFADGSSKGSHYLRAAEEAVANVEM